MCAAILTDTNSPEKFAMSNRIQPIDHTSHLQSYLHITKQIIITTLLGAYIYLCNGATEGEKECCAIIM